MRVLLNTCVLSELYKANPLAEVHEAVNNIPNEYLFLSVITIGEINKGITLLPDSHRKHTLSTWFGYIEHEYADMNTLNDYYQSPLKPLPYGEK